ncbi:MAG: sigma-70 family RNA polymerase sigma factor [Deltaproteobacteria bacterium]|nr:sigma-70 family RNA polymerase sigma factor [Deltaproteobacteria bacterium]
MGWIEPRHDVTQLLRDQASGREGALQELIETVYEELCAVAHRQMRGERQGHTLNTRALVNEAYMRLAEMDDFGWKNRGHFFGIAGLAMKQILMQHARGKMAKKRGEGAQSVPLEDVELLTDSQAESLLAIEQALSRLEQLGPRYRQVVEHKVFSGLTLEEIAETLDISKSTAKRDWVFSRAWLNQELGAGVAGALP